MITLGSLFSGIGGLELGLERAGMTVKWQVEIEPFCVKVLEKHWPDIKRYGDVKTIKWEEVERVDCICGGFPCPPVSCAGRRKGNKDERWLWPEFERCIRILQPRWVVVENVRGLLSANAGREFTEVLGGLSKLGYDAEWSLIGARDVGAPHKRERVFILAHSRGIGRGGGNNGDTQGMLGPLQITGRCGELADSKVGGCKTGVHTRREIAGCNASGCGPEMAHAEDNYGGSGESGLEKAERLRRGGLAGERPELANSEIKRLEGGIAEGDRKTGRCADEYGELPQWPPGPGETDKWQEVLQRWPHLAPAIESVVCGVATRIPDRLDRLRALGNAVVPRVAEVVGRMIIEQMSG